MLTFKEFAVLEEKISTKSRVRNWVVNLTKHSVERFQQRRADLDQQALKKMYRSMVNKIESDDLTGEILFYSRKLKQAIVVAVDAVKHVINVITTLPKGKEFAKPGTEKVIVEGMEFQQVVILEDD